MFHRGQRVAAHSRRYGGSRHGTDPDHMPSAHRRYKQSPANADRHCNSIELFKPGGEGAGIEEILDRHADLKTRLARLEGGQMALEIVRCPQA